MVRVRSVTVMTACLALAGTLFVHDARGQDLALAESLFQEGRKLLEAGKAAEACGKFAESLRIDRSSGTLLNLAECHVAEGKTASAWAEFTATAPLARQQGNAKRAEVALRRAAEVEKTLSHLTITVAAPTPGLAVFRGEQRLSESTLGFRVPTDPGTYVIRASAEGYKTWSHEVIVRQGGDTKAVTIPALEPQGVASPSPSASAAPPAASVAVAPDVSTVAARRPTAAYVALGAGAIFLGAGAYFGLSARSTYRDAEDRCGGHDNCDPSIKPDRDRASRQALLANVGVGLGVVGVGVGTALWLTSSSPKPRKVGAVRVAPLASPSAAGAFIDGSF